MKKYLTGIIAMSIAVVAVAFTKAPHGKNFNPLWYYKLSSTTGESDRTNYEPLTTQAALCPGSSDVRCVIEAPAFGSTQTPDLDNMNGVISKKP